MMTSQTPQKPAKQRSAKLLMFDLTLDGANLWFDIFNVVLLAGAFAVAVGTWGTIKTASIKEKFADERIAANEAETSRAVAELATAQADIAKAESETAKANERTAIVEATVAKHAWRRIKKEQHDAMVNALRDKSFPIIVANQSADPEAAVYANDLFRTFKDAGLDAHTESFIIAGGSPQFGVFIDAASGAFDLPDLKAALAAADIKFTVAGQLPVGAFNGVKVYVGTREPPF